MARFAALSLLLFCIFAKDAQVQGSIGGSPFPVDPPVPEEPPINNNGCPEQERASCPEYRQLEYMAAKGCFPVYCPYRCCAIRFRCIKKFNRLLEGRCFRFGSFYNVGDRVPSADPCRPGCTCQRSGFSCATFSCFRFPGCYQTFTQGTCCPTGGACATPSTPVCSYNGRQVFEGQILTFEDGPLSDTCRKCYCSSSYAGPFGTGCQKKVCGYDLQNQGEILAGCVPIFSGNACCQTTDFLCPGDPRVVPYQGCRRRYWRSRYWRSRYWRSRYWRSRYWRRRGRGQCRFGNIFLDIGQSLQLTTNGLKCKCFTPPDVLCKQPASPQPAPAPVPQPEPLPIQLPKPEP